MAVISLFDVASFQISYTTGKQYYYIYEGQPFEGQLSQGQSAFFEYSHSYQRGFKILLSRDYGQAEIAATTYLGNEEFLENLPQVQTNINVKWSTKFSNSEDHVRISTSDINFCSFTCRYIVEINAVTDVKYTLLLVVENEYVRLPNNKRLKDYIKKGESTMYMYEASQNFRLRLLLIAGNVTMRYSLKSESEFT